MKNILTRSELIKAQKAFCCKDWVNPIQDILNSSDDENIEIEDKYLDLIKDKAIWDQIKYCKTFGLDLKWNIPQEVRNFVLEKIKSCEIVINGRYTYYEENGKTLFYLNSETKGFWFHYHEIFEVLEEKYSLKYNEVTELMLSIISTNDLF